MQTKIIQEKENPLFKRKEIILNIELDVSPSKKDVEKLVAEKFSVPEENIYVKKIEGKFGSREFRVFVHVYSSAQDKKNIIGKSKKEEKQLNNKEAKPSARQ